MREQICKLKPDFRSWRNTFPEGLRISNTVKTCNG